MKACPLGLSSKSASFTSQVFSPPTHARTHTHTHTSRNPEDPRVLLVLDFLPLGYFFNWSVAAFQCCVSFCCTVWVSQLLVHTHIPFLLDLPPIPTSPALGRHRAASWAPCTLRQAPLAVSHVAVCMPIPVYFIPPPTPCPHVPSLRLCLFLHCRQVRLYHFPWQPEPGGVPAVFPVPRTELSI